MKYKFYIIYVISFLLIFVSVTLEILSKFSSPFIIIFLAYAFCIILYVIAITIKKYRISQIHKTKNDDIKHEKTNLEKSEEETKDGKIIDRYTDIIKGDMIYFIEVMDYKTNKSFTTKVSREEYQNTHIGMYIGIKRGFKKEIIL